jgi:hypothetical protein
MGRLILRSPLALLLVWLALILSLLVVRPQPFGLAFWSLTAAVVLVGFAQMRRSRLEAVAEQDAFAHWSNRLSALGAVRDVEDDGHLYEWLDPPHWQDVFAALERMPAGSRSLRQAIRATHPEVLQ